MMRIALLFPTASRPATRGYSVWLRSLPLVTEGLRLAGVELTTVAIAQTPDRPPSDRVRVCGAKETLQVTRLYEQCENFDLIHDLLGFSSLPFAMLSKGPVLATVWQDMWNDAHDVYEALAPRLRYIAPSAAQSTPELRMHATIPWGIAGEGLALGQSPSGELVFLGALVQQAGVEEAIQLAQRANRKLVFVGALADPAFVQEHVQPLLDNGQAVRILDPGCDQADHAIAAAAAVLQPGAVQGIHELALLDAMARGTPVLGWGDAQPPVIASGLTGLWTPSVSEAFEALPRVEALSREACRTHALETRSLSQMVASLVATYEQTIAQAKREDHRPWGYYVVLADEPNHKVKRLVVYPGMRLSLQRHRQRHEHWYVIDGEAAVVQDEDEVRLRPGQAIEIPRGCWHRVRNPGGQNLTIVEIQTGDYFGEDDIERQEDDYGRK